ncbi:cytochrome c oxidase assembly protein COX16 homolog, mitochondrial isoform X1 [Panthera uncia]|uniref:cytochrome c oxidase assembly protein COX16 homolog, mitochondrial isoform X1 n=1 Tax=Panthera uncia TaxID=29064 RepID=UPI0020FFBC9C|nr:cytochrome c oxidase assembly protein COX16 homolog, mitochondrial isoform X1 [Panthera uncia]
MSTQAVMRALRKNKTLRYGVPMLVLIVGGSFGLREFSQIRYDAVKIKIDPELEKKLKMNKVSLESEYEIPWGQEIPGWANHLGRLSYLCPLCAELAPQGPADAFSASEPHEPCTPQPGVLTKHRRENLPHLVF